MVNSSYQDLIVWQKSVDLVENICKITDDFPKRENFGLASQMQRAAIAIPSNIAEGRLRLHAKEFRQFLSIALGSAAELETQTLICQRVHNLDSDKISVILFSISEIKKMLYALIARLEE